MKTNPDTIREALEPCPFCGGEAHLTDAQHTHAGVDMILCENCGCRMYSGTIEKWNTRALSTIYPDAWTKKEKCGEWKEKPDFPWESHDDAIRRECAERASVWFLKTYADYLINHHMSVRVEELMEIITGKKYKSNSERAPAFIKMVTMDGSEHLACDTSGRRWSPKTEPAL